ncbi:hypothetical protein N185_19690 [Sinorhizobium sp. GW3]|nr:hypothetical protein N182_07825 [Sinorhizobium sp. GL2]KSV73959.1 hypothetical protein N185_19690 [Sinorhizobium sp. GW3]
MVVEQQGQAKKIHAEMRGDDSMPRRAQQCMGDEPAEPGKDSVLNATVCVA